MVSASDNPKKTGAEFVNGWQCSITGPWGELNMSSRMEITQVVAERTMFFVPNTGEREAASLRVGLPVKIDEHTWYCPYELRTDSAKKLFGMHGIDALQALELTMKTLSVEVAYWEKSKNGKFHFLDEEGAGI
jgi:hypothetical protein